MSVGGITSLSYTDMAALLKSAEQGDGSDISGSSYDSLLRVLADPDSEVFTVIRCLEDLEQCISYLAQGHPTLIRIIMNFNWLNRGPKLTSVYQAFLLNLVSAHINLLKPCLRSLIKRFIPDEKKDLNPVEQDIKLQNEMNFSHVHAVLKSLSHLVPMTIVVMPAVLEEMFPYMKRSAALEPYSRNVLTVATYMPTIRIQLLELVIKTMLNLDVHSSRTDIISVIGTGGADDLEDEDEDAMFDMDDLKSDIKEDLKPLKCDKEKKDEDEIKEEGAEEQLASALPLASSLDTLMSLALQFIKSNCCPNGKLDWCLTKKLYRELLSVFDKLIFPTHASCHVQFIMFFICSFKEELADGFIDYLWKKVTNPSTESSYRQTAACYIGSFLTRAAYISTGTCKNIMNIMATWLHAYIDQTSDRQHNADLAHHGPFYSVCQSLFYIFCFKHNDIMQLKKGHKWSESLNFQHIITSKLNPLRVCGPVIVKTFASATRMHQLAYCDTIIARNERYTLPISMSDFSLNKTDQQQLESYFPFDPYLLPRSKYFFTSLYREYAGVVPELEDEEMSDEEEDDFLLERDNGTHRSADQLSMSLGKSPIDFLHYGISPGFKNM